MKEKVGRKIVPTRSCQSIFSPLPSRSPLDFRVVEGEVVVRAKDPRCARPSPDEAQKFAP
jgi:hypothetical protein